MRRGGNKGLGNLECSVTELCGLIAHEAIMDETRKQELIKSHTRRFIEYLTQLHRLEATENLTQRQINDLRITLASIRAERKEMWLSFQKSKENLAALGVRLLDKEDEPSKPKLGTKQIEAPLIEAEEELNEEIEQDAKEALDHDIENLQWGLEDLRNKMASGEFDHHADWVRDNLKSGIENILSDEDLSSDLKAKATDFAQKVCAAIETYGEKRSVHQIGNALVFEIKSVSSISRIIRELEEAENFMKERKKLSDYLGRQINEARERLAWYRARKKLDEAEVARGGGNTKKADKLIGEAKVLLQQDWPKFFPDRKTPGIQ